jgi:hypothetical protein
VALEEDGERRRSWSFGIHLDEEDPDYSSDARGDNHNYYRGSQAHEVFPHSDKECQTEEVKKLI